MLRRNLLIAAPAFGMGACSTITGPNIDKTLAAALADVSTMAGAFKTLLVQLGTMNIPGLTVPILGTAASAITDIQTVAAQLAGVTTAAAAQPLVQKIETYVNTVVTVLAGLPLPPPISTGLQMAAILLPFIEMGVGLITNATPAAKLGAGTGISQEQARSFLQGLAAQAR